MNEISSSQNHIPYTHDDLRLITAYERRCVYTLKKTPKNFCKFYHKISSHFYFFIRMFTAMQ